jgi:hypothetical protein
MDDNMAVHGEDTNAYKTLAGKCEGKRSLRRPRRMWEDNTKMDVRVSCLGVDWIHVAQDRNGRQPLVNTV